MTALHIERTTISQRKTFSSNVLACATYALALGRYLTTYKVKWMILVLCRAITFCLACCMGCALLVGMIVACIAGIAYGYNYCLAEFLTLTRSEVTVYMRRGKFYDPPDIKGPYVQGGGRRSGADEEQEFVSNITSDYEESLRKTQQSARKSLSETWVKADDTRRYAERLTKYAGNAEADGVVMLTVLATTPPNGALRSNDNKEERYAERLSKFVDKDKPPVEVLISNNLPTTATGETRWYDDDSGKYAEFPKFVGKDKVEKEASTMKSFTPPDRTSRDFLEFAPPKHTVMVTSLPLVTNPPGSQGLQPLIKSTIHYYDYDSAEFAARRTKGPNAARNRTKSRRFTLKRISTNRSDVKIKFVEQKNQDSDEVRYAPMRHWAATGAVKNSPGDDYKSEDEDIIYKPV